MAQLPVQKATATGAAGTTVTTPAFASPTIVGNQLVSCSAVWNTTTGNSITTTDSKTNTWTRDKTQQQAANTGFAVATISNAILAAGKAGSSHTVTTTASLSSSDLQAVAEEYSGSTSTVDQSAAATAATSTTTLTATTSATTNANDLVIGCMAYSTPSTNNHVLTPAKVNGTQAGVTSLEVVQDGNTICGIEASYSIITATGTQAVNWTYDTDASGGYAAVVVVYMAAAVGGGKPPQDLITLNPGGIPMGFIPAAQGKAPSVGPVRWQNWESYPWSATAAASIDVASAGLLTITGAASLASSVGSLAAAGTLTITGAALLSATGTVAAAGTLLITGTAAMTSTGTLASAGTLVIVGAASLTAQGTLAAAGTLVINGAAALTGLGSLASAGTLVINGAANVTAPSANDIASAGTLLITSAAALTAVGSLAAAGAITITGFARLDDGAIVATIDQPSGGWPIFATLYERELSQRSVRKRKHQELEQETAKIRNRLDREIAVELRRKEKAEAHKVELARLKALAVELEAAEARQVYGEAVARALERAVTAGNFSALEALDRELQRSNDETEFLLMAATLILNEEG